MSSPNHHSTAEAVARVEAEDEAVARVEAYDDEDGVVDASASVARGCQSDDSRAVLYDAENPLAWIQATRTVRVQDCC